MINHHLLHRNIKQIQEHNPSSWPNKMQPLRLIQKPTDLPPDIRKNNRQCPSRDTRLDQLSMSWHIIQNYLQSCSHNKKWIRQSVGSSVDPLPWCSWRHQPNLLKKILTIQRPQQRSACPLMEEQTSLARLRNLQKMGWWQHPPSQNQKHKHQAYP